MLEFPLMFRIYIDEKTMFNPSAASQLYVCVYLCICMYTHSSMDMWVDRGVEIVRKTCTHTFIIYLTRKKLSGGGGKCWEEVGEWWWAKNKRNERRTRTTTTIFFSVADQQTPEEVKGIQDATYVRSLEQPCLVVMVGQAIKQLQKTCLVSLNDLQKFGVWSCSINWIWGFPLVALTPKLIRHSVQS